MGRCCGLLIIVVTQTFPSITRLYSTGKRVQGGSLLWSFDHCCHPDIPQHHPSLQRWQECSGWVAVAVVFVSTQSYPNITLPRGAGKSSGLVVVSVILVIVVVVIVVIVIVIVVVALVVTAVVRLMTKVE